MQTLLITAAMSITLTAPLAVVLADAPRSGDPLLVILPPWVDAGDFVEAAGGQEIWPLSAPFATLAYSEDPNFVDNLNRAGALAVRDGRPLAKLCGVA